MATNTNDKAVAYYETAEDYYNGRNGKEKDLKKAVTYYKKAAALEHIEACYKLGDCYFGGYGVKSSPELAGKWWHKAANAGHCKAQFECGIRNYLLQDYAQAAKWFRMAAEQGDPEAQHSLGCIYEAGEDVGEDFEEAEKWYSKAAEQGHKQAIEDLKELREYLEEHPEKKKKKKKRTSKPQKEVSAPSEDPAIQEENKKERRTRKIQAAWSITNNIIGYSLIAAVILFGVQNGYWGSTRFTVFCVAAVVYFLSKYLYFPLISDNEYRDLTQFKDKWIRESFTSIFGVGNVLFGRINNRTTYSFLSILYIPLIPTGRYDFIDNRKMIQIDSSYSRWDGDGSYICLKFKNFKWSEILYIYLKNWSFAVMVFCVIDTFFVDFFNPYVYGERIGILAGI